MVFVTGLVLGAIGMYEVLLSVELIDYWLEGLFVETH